jgi:hypothetical protein
MSDRGRGYSISPRSGFTEKDCDEAAKDGFTESMVRERDRRISELESLLIDTYEVIVNELKDPINGTDLLHMIREQIEEVIPREQLKTSE